MTDDLSLSEDAFIFGDGVMEKKETVALEKKVYDVLLKRNADLMDENERLREALEKTQTVLNTVDLSRLEYQDRSKFYDVVFIDGIIDKALKGGEE